MHSREELLQFIGKIEREEEIAAEYGKRWRYRDYRARRSIKAGELCETMIRLLKAEEKLKRSRRGSIGYRKARARRKAVRRKLRELDEIIKQPRSDYHPEAPQYITAACRAEAHRRDPARVVKYKDCKICYIMKPYIPGVLERSTGGTLQALH